MKRRLLNLLKLLSLVLALWPLGGCVYIPAADSPTRKGAPDPNRLIGRRTSNKPVRPGAVTREQVVNRFGKPFWEDLERRTLIYPVPDESRVLDPHSLGTLGHRPRRPNHCRPVRL